MNDIDMLSSFSGGWSMDESTASGGVSLWVQKALAGSGKMWYHDWKRYDFMRSVYSLLILNDHYFKNWKEKVNLYFCILGYFDNLQWYIMVSNDIF